MVAARALPLDQLKAREVVVMADRVIKERLDILFSNMAPSIFDRLF
jgi:hypothetical protein